MTRLALVLLIAAGCDTPAAVETDAGLGGMGGAGGTGGDYLTGVVIMQETAAGDTVGIYRSYANEWTLTIDGPGGMCIAPMDSNEMKRHGINISDAQGASW